MKKLLFVLSLLLTAALAAVTVLAALPIAALPCEDGPIPATGRPAAVRPQLGLADNVTLLHTSRGTVAVTEEASDDALAGTTRSGRTYDLYNGDRVAMGRLETDRNLREPVLVQWRLEAQDAVLRWYDAEHAAWRETPLAAGTYRASCLTVTAGGGETLIYTPKVYDNLGSGTLRHWPELDGALEVCADGGGFTLGLTVPSMPAGSEAHWTVASSDTALLDWAGGTDGPYWANYTLDGDSKWCFDGYYFPSPESYAPSGPDCYYRLPAAYLVKSFVYGGGSGVRAAEDLAVAALDTMARQQNEAGYFPTLPESQWLAESYGIGGGFYDTRFNTDLAEIFYKASQWLRCREFDETMGRYFDFFLAFAEDCHTETAGGGWLVADYGFGRETHTSLNHQLAEILALYHFSELLEREDLARLADRMLQAVRDTGGDWVRDDGDLHYGVFPDGSYGNPDYPYLTYNDLFQLQAYLTERGRPEPVLDRLMAAKRAWMDTNGVTGYLR